MLSSGASLLKGFLSQAPEDADPENLQAHYDSMAMHFADKIALICHNLDTKSGLTQYKDIIAIQSHPSYMDDFQLVINPSR